MKTLKMATGLDLPLAAVTESIALLAKRRAGKSTTARRLAEQLHRAGQQVVVADPKGDWWGLRFARDGKSPGLPFIVLGGEHGDVELEATGGELVARLVVEQRASVILDLSKFRKGEVCRFMTAFMETLYRLKAQEKHRTPMMLIIDEADAIAPQKPFADEARMVGAASDLVRRGGQRGIGVTMLTQRSAVLNKDLLTQIGILIVLQTIAPQDRKAIDAWIDVHGTLEQRAALMESLATLVQGEGWVWAPGWPSGAGIFQRQRFLLPETFDSSKTPESGGKAFEPKNAAAVDLDAFRQDMAATIEKAKADDPRELRKALAEKDRRIKELERAASGSAPTVQGPAKTVEVLTNADREQLLALEKAMDAIFDKVAQTETRMLRQVGEALDALQAAAPAAVTKAREQLDDLFDRKGIRTILEKLRRVSPEPRAPGSQLRISPSINPGLTRPGPTRDAVVQMARCVAVPQIAGSTLPGPEQKILNAVAELEVLGLHPADKIQVGLLAGYTNVRSGGFSEPLGRLVAAGHVVSPQVGKLAITDAGRALTVLQAAPTSPEEMQARVLAKLTGPEQKLLRELLRHYPMSLTKEALGTACGYSNIRSGGFSEPLGRLNTLGIVRTPARGEVVAAPFLFLEV